MPTVEEVARRTRRDADELLDERHPGLREILLMLRSMMGKDAGVSYGIPEEKIFAAAKNGGELDELSAIIKIDARTVQAVQVLHLVLARGLEEVLDEGANATCKHCDTAVFYRSPVAHSDGTWLHLETGRVLCTDGINVATKRRRPRRPPTDEQ